MTTSRSADRRRERRDQTELCKRRSDKAAPAV